MSNICVFSKNFISTLWNVHSVSTNLLLTSCCPDSSVQRVLLQVDILISDWNHDSSCCGTHQLFVHGFATLPFCASVSISCPIWIFLFFAARTACLSRWKAVLLGLTSVFPADDEYLPWLWETELPSCPGSAGCHTWGERVGEGGWAERCSMCCCNWWWRSIHALSLQRGVSVPCEGTARPVRSPTAARFASGESWARAGLGHCSTMRYSRLRAPWPFSYQSIKCRPWLEQNSLISKKSIISWTCSSDIMHLRTGRWSPHSISCLQAEGFRMITFGKEFYVFQLGEAGWRWG